MKYGIYTLDDFDVQGKTVLCRVDINSPVDPNIGQLRDTTRIERSLPTITELSREGAKLVLMAHQGSDLEYGNYATTRPHAAVLTKMLEREVQFIDDVCGPAAREAIQCLRNGEVLLLDNVRFMAEEMTLFEMKLNLSPMQQANTLVVRTLAPLADLYVCDAFAAIHRSQPTLVGFQEMLPSAMGRLFEEEYGALSRLAESPEKPCLFVLGGAKVQDAFMIMSSVLADGTCDEVLASGLVANIMLMARGIDIGGPSRDYILSNALGEFVERSKQILEDFGDRITLPSDIAYVSAGRRKEARVEDLPTSERIVDIGRDTVDTYVRKLAGARTVFVNGPAGVFENPESEYGTKCLWKAVAHAKGFSVIGGGDSIAAANKYGLEDRFSYVSTAGGALIRFLSKEELPVVAALKRAARREEAGRG